MLQDIINAAAVLGLGLGFMVVMFALLCGPARTLKFARWIYWVAHHHCTKTYRRMRRRGQGRAPHYDLPSDPDVSPRKPPSSAA